MMMIIIAKQWCIIMCGGLMRRCCNFEFKCSGVVQATAIVLRPSDVRIQIFHSRVEWQMERWFSEDAERS